MSTAEDVRDFQGSLRALLTWFLGPNSLNLDREGDHAVQMIARQLSTGYKNLQTDVFSTTRVMKQVAPFEIDRYREADPDYFKPLLALHEFANRHLRDYVCHFYLHGSMATMDYCKGWSDVDTLVVVAEHTINDPGRLKEFRKLCLDAHPLLLRMDPLQHHGFIFVTETDLKAYPSIYLPMQVLDHAVSILGDRSKIIVHERDARQEAIDALTSRHRVLSKAVKSGVYKHHAYRGEHLQSEFRNASNGMYQLKYLLESIMTMPAYVMEALGQPCHKGESFALCEPRFDAERWDIVQKATRVRSNWPDRELHPFKGNAIPDWVQDVLGPAFMRESFLFMESVMELLRAEPVASTDVT